MKVLSTRNTIIMIHDEYDAYGIISSYQLSYVPHYEIDGIRELDRIWININLTFHTL